MKPQRPRPTRDEDDDRFLADCERLVEACRALYSPYRAMRDAYPVLVTTLVRLQLQQSVGEVYELPYIQCQASLEDGRGGSGSADWDGVLYAPRPRHLYLVTAKHDLESTHVADMGPRIQHTLQFMQRCVTAAAVAGAAAVPRDARSYARRELCCAWASLAVAERVVGVVGAPVFSPEMLRRASDEGLLAVFFDRGTYRLQPPPAGMLRCHKTGQRVAWLGCAQMTEEDVEEALEEEAALEHEKARLLEEDDEEEDADYS
jgi:hypothetical protein